MPAFGAFSALSDVEKSSRSWATLRCFQSPPPGMLGRAANRWFATSLDLAPNSGILLGLRKKPSGFGGLFLWGKLWLNLFAWL